MTALTMRDRDAVLRALDAQCQDYQLMHRESLRQRDSLRGQDMEALDEATAKLQALMERVRRRHQRIPGALGVLARHDEEVARRTACLRRTILAILDLRDESETVARTLLADTRRRLRQVGHGQRAARGYRRARPQAARFVDGQR